MSPIRGANQNSAKRNSEAEMATRMKVGFVSSTRLGVLAIIITSINNMIPPKKRAENIMSSFSSFGSPPSAAHILQHFISQVLVLCESEADFSLTTNSPWHWHFLHQKTLGSGF